MRISISISNYSWPGGRFAAALRDVARAAEDADLDTLWVPDHLLQADPTVGPDDPRRAGNPLLATTIPHTRIGKDDDRAHRT